MIRAFESVFNYWEGVKLGLVVVGEKERGSNHRSAPGGPAAAKRNPEKTEYAMWECSPTSGFEARAFALYLQDVIPHAPQLQRTTIQTASAPCRREKPKPLRALTSWPPVPDKGEIGQFIWLRASTNVSEEPLPNQFLTRGTADVEQGHRPRDGDISNNYTDRRSGALRRISWENLVTEQYLTLGHQKDPRAAEHSLGSNSNACDLALDLGPSEAFGISMTPTRDFADNQISNEPSL